MIKVVKFSERYQFKHCLQNQQRLKSVKQGSKKIIAIGSFVIGGMTIRNNDIDLLYQNHSSTQQVVQTERVDNSNFILKFEDIQNTKQNTIDKDKKQLVMDTVVSLSGGAFITEFICFIMFLKLLQLGYEVPPALPQAVAQFPGVDGLFVAPDIPGTKPNHRTESINPGPNIVTVRS